ncbi:MAG: ROK family protein [Rhizobiaceae bacterium]
MAGPLALGIDLGGTQLRAAIVDRDGLVVERASLATDVAGGPTAIVAQMVELARTVSAKHPQCLAQTIGVCSPGPLDTDVGVILEIATMPGWQNFPLRQKLSEAFGQIVILENDAIAAAFGEWKFGAGAGTDNMVYVTVSTGIGGGVVVDGHLLRGNRGMAGHIGHMMISPEGPRCGCGGIGCFEALASGTNFAIAGHAKGFADGAAVVDAARRGNVVALELVRQEAEYLAYGFASLVHLFSPQRLVMGGGVSKALDLMIDDIRAKMADIVMPPFRGVQVVAAKLGDNSGLVGAAGLVMA